MTKDITTPEKKEDAKKDYLGEDGQVDPKKIWKLSPGKNESVPQIAQKLRPAKKKQRIYYAYTYDTKTGEGGKEADAKKVKVIRKRVERRQPENLIDILVMQKQYLYDKEQRMRVLKEQDEDEWAKMTQEYNSSEEEDDEENFAWYKPNDKETYFVLCTKHKNVYNVGQQVFHCYGRRTNRFLLLNYGFCLNNNKYNSLSFRVWVNFNWQEERKKVEEQKAQGVPRKDSSSSSSDGEGDEKDNRISKVIRLKKTHFNEEIFAYLRANLLNTYKGKNLPYLLVSSPVDVEFEMLVVACTINLLKGLMTSRFKTPLEKDQELLRDASLPIRNRFAVLHRMNAKDILTENINYCNILMRILARFGTAGQVLLEPKDYKNIYMQFVEGGYEKEEELMRNRIRIRRYLRELIINQKRVLSAALDKEYVDKVKEYFDNKKKEEAEKAARQAKKAQEEGEEEEEEDDDEEEGESDEEDEEGDGK